MANYFLNDDGSLTKKNKKKKGNNYILNSDGTLTLNPNEKEELTEKESIKPTKRTWFNTDTFKDGYQFGDVTKSVTNTVKDIKQDVAKGILGIGEGAIDFGAYLVGGGANILGAKDFAESTKKFIAKDLIENSKLATMYTNVGDAASLGSFLGASITEGFKDKEKSIFEIGKDKLLNEDFEKASVLGDKSDSLVQSGGQLLGTIGLQAAGVPWWLTTGVTSFAGGTEEAFKDDASYGKAGAYGLINAGAEILTEKISGGISFGGKTLDTGLKKLIGEKIANKTLSTLTKFGLDAGLEGFEEVATEVIQNVGKKLTYEDEKTWNELLTSEEAMNSYLESFIGGAVLGGGMNTIKVANSIKTGRDYDTGLTSNEQKIVDKEVETRKAEAQKEGKTLSKKEIAKIEEQVKNDLFTGNLNTTPDTEIETTEINKEQSVEDIDKQIIELEKQLEKTEDDAEYERISNQIRVLEEKANQLEQQDISPVKQTLNEELENNLVKQMETLKTDTETLTNDFNDYLEYELGKDITQVTDEDINAFIETYNDMDAPDNNSSDAFMTQEEFDRAKNIIENYINNSATQDIAPVKQNTIDYSAVKEEEILPYLEQENKGRMESITDKDAPIETTQEADYMPDTISVDKKSLNALSKNIKKELGLNKTQTTELESIIQEVSKSETATREDLYNTIQKRFSEQTIEHKNEELAEIKRDLRNRRIYVDDYLKSEFRDGFNKIRQQNFNKLKFTNDGTSVDSVYQELSEIYPAYFPNDINNAQDQLQRIVDVANEDVVDVENYVLPDETIQDVTDFVYDSINDYKLDQRVKASEEARKSPIDDSMIPPIQQELSDLTSEIKNMMKDTKKELKSLKKEIKGVKTDINEALEDIAPIKDMKVNDEGQGTLDLGIVNKLNAPEGEIKNKPVEPIDLDKAKQLTIDGTEENLVTKTKKELRKALLGTEAQKEFILGALDNAKNRSMALMNNTDTIRNTELVFGRDAGSYINEVIFQKEIDNEADSIAWQNKERDEIKALGIKARSKESAAVQKYGEKQYVNDVGELVAYGDKELSSEFSDAETREKIKRAAQVIRNKYDNYIDRANEVLTKLGFDAIPKRKDYMRHFQELNDVFSRYGIPFNAQNMTEHVLPTDINGLTENWSPQKNYFANTQRRTGVKTTYDAITGVDGYIGGIANLIYHTEDIQRGRAFEELIRETYGEDKGFENLDNLPDELKQARAEKIQDNHLSNYAAWLHEWTNNVAGKKSKVDRSVESIFGRRAFSFLDTANKQVGANLVGLNVSSSLTNLIAPVKAAAKTKKLAVLKGTADTIKNIFIKDNFMDNNKFLISRMGTEMLSQNVWGKMQNAGYIFMKGMDWFSSNQIVRSKFYELRAKGMSEQQAHAEAGKFAARIMSDRTKGAAPQLYNSKVLGLITKFQQEVNNDLYSMFYDTYHESKENAKGNALKMAAGMTFTLGQLFAFTHLFSKAFESIAGYTPTLDVIEILKTAFGWGEDDDEEKTTSERLKAAADKLVDGLPYVNILTGGGRIPVTSGLPNLVGVATGGKDQYGNELTLEDELKKLLFLVPPTGGNQVKKTYQGLSMFDEDLPVSGSYTDSGNLRFPVEDTPLNRLQAGLFGQWANKNAGEYFDKERQPLKEKQIQEFKDLDMPISDYWEYREGLKDKTKTEEKFEYINSLDVSDEQKNIMINNALTRKEQVDMSGYDDFGSYEEFDYATKNPEKYELITQIDTFDNYNSYKEDIESIREQFSTDKGYSTAQRKAAVQEYIESLSLSVPKKIMLEKLAGGYSIKAYEGYMFEYIESLPMSAKEKQELHKQLFD